MKVRLIECYSVQEFEGKVENLIKQGYKPLWQTFRSVIDSTTEGFRIYYQMILVKE